MKYPISAALAAIAIFSGSALLSPALAEDIKSTEIVARDSNVAATDTVELQRELSEQVQKMALAVEVDALLAASDLGLDNDPGAPISVLMASKYELR